MAKELIHTKMVEIMKAIGPVEKKRSTSSYKFRGVSDALSALYPALTEAGVHLETTVLRHSTDRFREPKPGSSKDERNVYLASVLLRVRFVADDGSAAITEAAAEGQDQQSGDKASSKAMSAAFKYAVFLGLCLPTDSLADNDEEASGGNGSSSGGDSGSNGVPVPLPVNGAAVHAVAPVAITPAPPVAPATPTSTLNGAQSALSVRDSEPVSQHLIDEIHRLASVVNMPAENLQASVEKRGVKSIEQLSVGQANEMIANLNGLITKVQSQPVFQPSADSSTH